MKELALHMLDLARNSLSAGATCIEMTVNEQEKENLLIMEVNDNGRGITEDIMEKISVPFFTTAAKKTGLGIPLFKQHAEAAGGGVRIRSVPGKGTWLSASFVHDHIDRQPLGNLTATLISLIRSHPEIDWIFRYRLNGCEFVLDMRSIRAEMDGVPVNQPQVIEFLKEYLEVNIKALSI